MSRNSISQIAACLLLLMIAACAEKHGQDPSDGASSQDAGIAKNNTIAWFDGSVEDAFARAASANKPIFLYWGAEWCPPCHELKATIFQRPEFIRQSLLFLPVYLDGDSERAQLYGEKFGVFGYPTVIIFSPEGEEITRIPGGMDIQQYVDVMDMALNALRPVSEMVASVREGNELQVADWKMLASYSWGQDSGRALGETSLFETATLLAEACPSTLPTEKSQLQMLAVTAWLRDEARDEALAADLSSAANAILADPGLAAANSNSFLYGSEALINSLAEELSLIHISEPTRPVGISRMPSSA